MKTTLSERGQITVPKAIRENLGLSPGVQLELELVRGGFVARKKSVASPWRHLVGILNAPGETDRLIDSMRGPVDTVKSES